MNCVKTLSKWMWNHERRHFRKDNKTSLVKTFKMWQLRVKLESLHILETRTYKGSQSWCCHNSLLIKPVNTKLLMLGTRQVLQRLPAVILFGKKVSPARAFVFSKLYYFWTKLLILLLLSLFFRGNNLTRQPVRSFSLHYHIMLKWAHVTWITVAGINKASKVNR